MPSGRMIKRRIKQARSRPTSAVPREDRVSRCAVSIRLQSANRAVMNFQLGKSFTTAKVKVFDYVIAFDRRRVISLWLIRLRERRQSNAQDKSD